jgi:Carboxypeptidase regulatory-like domain
MEYDFRPKIAVFCLALLLLALVTASTARADELTGRIRGVVSDPTGAVLAGVKVIATNVNTGISWEVETSSDGSYQFLNLPVGTYKVTATKTGFRGYEAANIALNLNQVYVLNVPLELGRVSEMITVEASTVQVETTSTQLGTVVSGDTIRDMPLNGRNWIQLQQLQPGVVSSSDRFGSNFATNGSETQQNSYLINGVDSNDLPLNTPLVIPSPDAITR